MQNYINKLKQAYQKINISFLYIKSKITIIKNTKKDSEKKHAKKIFLKKKKTKGEKRPKEDTKILLKKKKKKRQYIVNIIKIFLKSESRSYLSIEEILV